LPTGSPGLSGTGSCGWEEESRSYKYDSWQYQGESVPVSLAEHYVNTTESFAEKLKRSEKGPPSRDPTLQHPHCVYQILLRHWRIHRRWSNARPVARATDSSKPPKHWGAIQAAKGRAPFAERWIGLTIRPASR
jgi:hypothetical protein